MGKTLLVCENSGQITGVEDIIVYWASFEEDDNSFSIPRFIEQNAISLKEQYLTWLYELGNSKINGKRLVEHLAIRDDFSFWWMSLQIEKSQWKSPALYDAFRLLALDRLIKPDEFDHIAVEISNVLASKAIAQWCLDSKIKLEIRKPYRANGSLKLRNLFDYLPYTLKAGVAFIRYIIHRWPMRKVRDVSYTISDKKIGFISYLFNLDKNLANKGRFYSRYWASLHELLLQHKLAVGWLHLYVENNVLSDSSKAVDLVESFNDDHQSKQFHTLLDSALTLKVLFGVVRDYYRVWWVKRYLQDVEQNFVPTGSSINLWPIMERDWNESLIGKTAIENCFFLNLFESVVLKLPYQERTFYLMENQAWERCLSYVWHNAEQGELVGVPHTTVSKWDLRHFFSSQEYGSNCRYSLPLPDKVALNGEAAYKAYLDGGFPEDRMLKVEALRYLYLGFVDHESYASPNADGLRLLVLGDYLPSATNKQMTLLSHAARQLPEDTEILVKAHPACPIALKDWPDLDMRIVSGSLEQLVHEYDIAYTSNPTSAAVDAYLAGKRVITILDPDSFNMSPLSGYPGVDFVANSEELIDKLTYDSGCLDYDHNFFFTDTGLSRWRSLLFVDYI